MIDRRAALGLLSGLPDAMLMKALAVAGASAPDAGGADFLGDLDMGAEDNTHIEPWNDRQISYDGGKDRPAMIDKMWAKPGLMNAQVPVEGGAMDGGDPYLQTGGV